MVQNRCFRKRLTYRVDQIMTARTVPTWKLWGCWWFKTNWMARSFCRCITGNCTGWTKFYDHLKYRSQLVFIPVKNVFMVNDEIRGEPNYMAAKFCAFWTTRYTGEIHIIQKLISSIFDSHDLKSANEAEWATKGEPTCTDLSCFWISVNMSSVLGLFWGILME